MNTIKVRIIIVKRTPITHMNKSEKSIIDHLEDFLDWLDIEKGLSSKTQENYKRFLERFFHWLKVAHLEALRPHQLESTHIWDYRVFLSRSYSLKANKSLQKSTQNYYLIALRSFLTYFVVKDILSLPPDKIKLSKLDKEKNVKFLDLDKLKKLFATPDISTEQGLRDRAMLEVFFSTGMRISELTSLDKEQIKLSHNTKDLELGIVGKGGKARTVYFSAPAVEWLKKYLNKRSENKEDKDKALFINYRGLKKSSRRLTPRSIEKIIKKYALMAGLPINTTPHVLRHSFATDLLSKGVDLRSIQEFLGHKSILATQIYTHITNKRLRDIHREFHSENLNE